jgi:2-dehydro-3-deoxyphosphogluconate aldolase/(4S)-4-hydroxy-2-oxoglutarate aldolase
MTTPTGPGALTGHRIIPVVVLDDADFAVDAVAALRAGGISCAEITLRTPAAIAAIEKVAQVGETLVGAGTVLTPHDVDAVADAGARFVVTPGFARDVVERAVERGLDVLPGVATASEVLEAVRAGLGTVKLFPADLLGGLAMVRALGGPFPQVRFVPSGGVSPANLGEYLEHPRVPAVSGSWMIGRELLRSRDTVAIERLSAQAVNLARAALAGRP